MPRRRASTALLLTDLPPEAARRSAVAKRARARRRSFSSRRRRATRASRAVDRASDGFVYYVSTTGVTGTRSELDPALLERLDEVRAKRHASRSPSASASRRHEHYEALRDHCDAIVVGSAIVRRDRPKVRAAGAAAVVREILGATSA